MNRVITQLVFGTVLSFSLISCMTVAPVNQHYERAATLGKGNFEVAGNISRYEAEGVGLNRNYGFRGGYGVTDELDVKVRYEKRIPYDTSIMRHTNYLSIVPKYNIRKNQLSVLMPISRYEDVYRFDGKRFTDVSYSFSPQLLRTYTNEKNTFDFSVMGRFDFLIHKYNDDEFLLGLNMGAGLSTDLDKWSVRPEIGLQFKPHNADYAWSYGLGLQLTIPGFRNR